MYGMFTYTFGSMYGFHVGKYTSPMDICIYIYINFYCSHQQIMALPPVFFNEASHRMYHWGELYRSVAWKAVVKHLRKSRLDKTTFKKEKHKQSCNSAKKWLQINVSFWYVMLCWLKIWATNKWRKEWANKSTTVYSNWLDMGRRRCENSVSTPADFFSDYFVDVNKEFVYQHSFLCQCLSRKKLVALEWKACFFFFRNQPS